MKKIMFLGMAICALLALGLWAFALPLDQNVEAKTPEGGLGSLNERTSPSDMLRDMKRSYLTPICEEWPYIDGNGDALAPGRCNNLNVQKDTPLSEALDAAMAGSGGMYRWERNPYGSFCIVGTSQGGTAENCLDTRIDLHVEKASTWEALCAVAKAVNEKPVNGRRMGIYPSFIVMRPLRTPEGLKDNLCITLDLKDVPARDAVCAIIAQAPLKMSYWYANEHGMGDAPPAARLTILIYNDDGTGYHGIADMPNSEIYSYTADYYEMVGDEKHAASYRRLSEACRKEEAENRALKEQQEAQQQAQEEPQKEEAQTEAQ